MTYPMEETIHSEKEPINFYFLSRIFFSNLLYHKPFILIFYLAEISKQPTKLPSPQKHKEFDFGSEDDSEVDSITVENTWRGDSDSDDDSVDSVCFCLFIYIRKRYINRRTFLTY